MMKWVAHGGTDRGRRRARNEDRFIIDGHLQLAMVCDGMGGHAGGEVAAELASRAIHDFLRVRRAALAEAASEKELVVLAVGLVRNAVQLANREVYEAAQESLHFRAMGTTLTMALLVGRQVVVAHAGDSRLYRRHGNRFQQITHDHTVYDELVRRGVCLDEEMRRSQYGRMLTRCIGQNPTVDPEVCVFDVTPDDTLLLCTDGLSNYFTGRDEIARVLAQTDAGGAVERLIEMANERGGGDNLTAIVVELVADGSEKTRSADLPERTVNMLESLESVRDTPIYGVS